MASDLFEGGLVKTKEEIAKKAGCTVSLDSNVDTAVKGADVLCTDIWGFHGEPDEIWEKDQTALAIRSTAA